MYISQQWESHQALNYLKYFRTYYNSPNSINCQIFIDTAFLLNICWQIPCDAVSHSIADLFLGRGRLNIEFANIRGPQRNYNHHDIKIVRYRLVADPMSHYFSFPTDSFHLNRFVMIKLTCHPVTCLNRNHLATIVCPIRMNRRFSRRKRREDPRHSVWRSSGLFILYLDWYTGYVRRCLNICGIRHIRREWHKRWWINFRN